MPKSYNGWLSTVLDSPAKVRLVAFFYLNQYAMDDARGLSVWVGLDPEGVARAAEELAQAHVLKKIGNGRNAIFTFNAGDEEIQRAVADFIRTHPLPSDQRFQTPNDLRQGRNHSHE